MAYNPLGQDLLALLDDKRISAILRHNNANWPCPKSLISEASHLRRKKMIRKVGYSQGPGKTWPNTTILAAAVRPHAEMPRLSVAVGALDESLSSNRQQIIDMLQAMG